MSPRFRSAISIISNKFAPRLTASAKNSNNNSRITSPFFMPPIVASIPPEIERPPYALNPPILPVKQPTIQVRTDPVFFEKMRKAGEVAAIILDAIGKSITPGISTSDLDDFAIAHCSKHKCYPSPLGYHGFPRAICTSVNEVACHGVPSQLVVEDGDIITLDITVYLDGVHADCAATFPVGHGVSEKAKILISAAQTAAACAAATCVPNASLSDIANICDQVAQKNQCVVLPSVCGHGIGVDFHETPTIPHSMKTIAKNRKLGAIKLKSGMTLTVEPCLALGDCSGQLEIDKRDGWTVRTTDGSLTAQFEHTLIVTERGPQIVTCLP